jgi:arylsulfatase A
MELINHLRTNVDLENCLLIENSRLFNSELSRQSDLGKMREKLKYDFYQGNQIRIQLMKILSVSAVTCLNLSFDAAAQNKTENASANSKPNVIYILADDLGYGELGCYGQKKIQTPNLDRLASEGIRFTQHYVGTPVSAPSRCNLMTGQHSGHAYIRNNMELGGYVANKYEPGQFPIPEKTPTIASLFKQAGYATAAIGKWGLGNYNNEGDPLKHGFDFYYGYYDQKHAHNYYPTHLWKNGVWDTLNNPEIDVHPVLKREEIKPDDIKKYFGNEYSIDKMTANAVDFIQENKNKPFFLYLAYTLPHVSLQVPQADIEYYKKLFQEKQNLYFTMYIPSYFPLSTYAAMITYLDKQVLIIEDLLKNLGLDRNTIVMFCSDNGPIRLNGDNDGSYFNSSGSLRGGKMEVYEGGIREPFIVKWPGKIAPGQVTDFISATYDMMETFADLLQVQAPRNDGISILPTLLGNKQRQKQRDHLYWEFPPKGGNLAIRMGNWKGVKTNVMINPKTPWQIYNLETDPKEAVDIVTQHPELVKKFDEIVQNEHTTPVRPEWDLFKKN